MADFRWAERCGRRYCWKSRRSDLLRLRCWRLVDAGGKGRVGGERHVGVGGQRSKHCRQHVGHCSRKHCFITDALCECETFMRAISYFVVPEIALML